MRVLFLHGQSGMGGGERMLEDALVALNRRIEAHAVLPGGGPLADRLRASGIGLTLIPMPASLLATIPLGLSPAAIARAHAIGRRLRPEIVHVHDARVLVYGMAAAWAAGAPILVTSHGRWDQRWFLQRAALRLAGGRVLAVSEKLCETYHGRGPWFREHVGTLHPGVDVDRFRPAADPGAARVAAGLERGDPVVAIVGRFHRAKNHLLFLDAAELVARRVPGCRFLVVGDRMLEIAGETEVERQAILRRVHESEILRSRVVMTGAQVDVVPWLHASDLLVCSSDSESFGLGIVEAMACGLPVVSTACGGPEETVTDGKTGYLVPCGDSKGLAGRMAELLEAPERRRTMGAAARQAAVDRFALGRYCDRWLSEYAALASAANR